MENILVINLGLRSIRAIVFNEKGEKLIHSWYPIRTIIKGDQVEQDPNEWWSLCQDVIKEATQDENIKDQIKAITVTSSSCFLVPVDKNGNPTKDAMIVSDKRAAPQAEKLKQDKHLTAVFENPNNLAVASYLPPKILWLKENEPDIFNRTAKFIGANDFLIYKLSGKYATDPLNAEKCYFDQVNKAYPKVLLNVLGITKDHLPKVYPIGHMLGHLRSELMTAWGLKENVKIYLSTYDAICAFWGAGVHDDGQASNVCGTVTSFRVHSPRARAARYGILSQCFDKNNSMYIVGGSNNLDGGLLEWAKDVFYGDAYPSKHIFNIMEDEASLSNQGANGLIFLPYLLGERVPFFDTTVRGMFFGLERHHKRQDLIRSIFESSGFLAMSILEAIESLGQEVTEIRLSGGLARNNLISQVRANITGKNILLVKETETTALGAFMIVAISLGWYPDFKKTAKIVKIKKTFTPDEKAHERYKNLYKLFRELYHDTNHSFAKRLNYLSQIYDQDSSHVIDNL